MKAITLWQPWASWIAWGWKTIETRVHDRFACLAGSRIAIHAGKRLHREAIEIARPFLTAERIDETLDRWGDLPLGKVVAEAEVHAAMWLAPAMSRYALCDTDGLFGLCLRAVEALVEPIEATGQLGIWNWTPPDDFDLATPPQAD